MKDWLVLIIGAAVLLVGLMGVLRIANGQPSTPTNLNMVRLQDFPGYGKVALFRHELDGLCVLMAPNAVLVGVPKEWCER